MSNKSQKLWTGHVVLIKLACIATLLTISGCAPTMAGSIRQEKVVTIGFLGAQYRPDKSISVNAAANAEYDSFGSANSDDLEKRSLATKNAKRERLSLLLSMHVHPFDSSGFYLGLGAQRRMSKETYMEYAQNYASEDAPSIAVTHASDKRYVGVPIGWTWIWKSGFTLHLDFGPYFNTGGGRDEFSHAEGVDTASRDKTLNQIDTYRSSDNAPFIMGIGYLGWSF